MAVLILLMYFQRNIAVNYFLFFINHDDNSVIYYTIK